MLLTIPVEPDAETARQWAEEELSRSVYDKKGPGWIERVISWLSDLLARTFDFGSGGLVKGIIVLGIVGLLIFLLIRVTAGPVRRAMSARREHFVFEDDHRDSRTMRVSADAAAANGDWTEAVLERFRAIVRSLEERAILEDLPGITADEAAKATGTRFPDVAIPMAQAAEKFDGARYGHVPMGPEDDAALRSLDSRLAGRSLLHSAAP